MKKNSITFLLLLLSAISIVACSSQEEEIATILPEAVCNQSVLSSANENSLKLSSVEQVMDMNIKTSISQLPEINISMDGAMEQVEQVVSALDMNVDINIDPDEVMEMAKLFGEEIPADEQAEMIDVLESLAFQVIYKDGIAYTKMPEAMNIMGPMDDASEWTAVQTNDLATTAVGSMEELNMATEEVLELLSDENCSAVYETFNGSDALAMTYTDVKLSEIEELDDVTSFLPIELDITMPSVTYYIGNIDGNEQLLGSTFEGQIAIDLSEMMDMAGEMEDADDALMAKLFSKFNIYLTGSQTNQNFNQPVSIIAPEGVEVPSFEHDIPMPSQYTKTMETEDTLSMVTTLPADELIAEMNQSWADAGYEGEIDSEPFDMGSMASLFGEEEESADSDAEPTPVNNLYDGYFEKDEQSYSLSISETDDETSITITYYEPFNWDM